MYNVIHQNIGTRVNRPDWPSNDILGLIDALHIWPLDLSFIGDENCKDYRGPFKHLQWGHCIQRYDAKRQRMGWVSTAPAYPEHPNAIGYNGNFIGYSFGFHVVTDDQELIKTLDYSISLNLKKFYGYPVTAID